MADKYKLRSKWKKNQIREPVPKAEDSRDVIQMETVDFGGIFAFTGVDIYTREVEAKLFPSLAANDGLNFLNYSFDKRDKHTSLPKISLNLQTDLESPDHTKKRTKLHRIV